MPIYALVGVLNDGSLGVTNANGILTATNLGDVLGLIFADQDNIVHLAYYNAEGMVVPVPTSAWGKSAVVIPHVIHYIGTDNANIPDLTSDGVDEKNLVGSTVYPTLEMTGDMDGHYGQKIWVKTVTDGQPHTLKAQYGKYIKNGMKDENATIEKMIGLYIEKQTGGEENIGFVNEGTFEQLGELQLGESIHFNPFIPEPPASGLTIFCQEDEFGKAQLAVLFPNGNSQILVTET